VPQLNTAAFHPAVKQIASARVGLLSMLFPSVTIKLPDQMVLRTLRPDRPTKAQGHFLF
jgi:hypothetical protein